MPLYQKLAELESKMAEVEIKLGHPNRRNLLVRSRVYNQTTKLQEIEDILILPQPYITPVSPRFVNLQVSIDNVNSISVSMNDIEVEIPRIYSKGVFLPEGKNRAEFIIDPPVTPTNQIIYSDPSTKSLVGVSKYNLIFISEKEPTVWRLILRKEKDSR